MTILAPMTDYFTKRREVDTDALHQWRKVDEAEERLLRGVAVAVKAGRDRVTLDNLAYLIAPHAHHKAPPSGGYEFQTIAQALDAMLNALGASLLNALDRETTAAAMAETERLNALMRDVRATEKGDALSRANYLATSGLVAKDILLDFKTVNDRALSQVRLELLNLIEGFTLDQRKAVYHALHDGVTRGLNPLNVARQIKSSMTLTPRQMRAVDRYRYSLENAHRDVRSAADALNRGLRDARADRSIQRAKRTQTALSPKQINSMVDRYRENYAGYRARTIARTEALRITHQGEAAVWETAIRRGDIQSDQVVQRWVTARDERVRHSHAFMMGQKRAWGKPFTTGRMRSLRYPGDRKAPPEETVNCRCIVIRTLKPAKVRREPERQPVDVRPIPQVGPVDSKRVVTPPAEIGAPAGAPLSFDLSRVGTGYTVDAEVAIVELDVKALDAAWRAGPPDYYLPRGTVGKVPRIQAAAEGGFAVPLPEVALDEAGAIAFTDGRHRIVYVRDISGQRYVPVAVPAEQREQFLRLFAPSAGARSRAATAQLAESMGARSRTRGKVPTVDAGQIAEAQRAELAEVPLTADEIGQQARAARQPQKPRAAESGASLTPESMRAQSRTRGRRAEGAYMEGELTSDQASTVGDLSADYAGRFGYLPFNDWDIPKARYRAVVAALRRALKDGKALTNAERLALLSIKKGEPSPRVFIRFGKASERKEYV